MSMESIVITMFLTHMQNNGIWPCRVQIGEPAKPVDAKEVFQLRDDFAQTMNDQEDNG